MNEDTRVVNVKQGLEELLTANNCRLEPRVTLTHGNVKGELVIVPNPEVKTETLAEQPPISETTPEVTPENPAPAEGEASPANPEQTPVA